MADAATLDRVDESIDALCASLQVITRDAPLRAFLQHIANLARVLVNARYCALGIVEGERFTDFIVSGISEAERAAIGALPRGDGILGVVIRERRSLRLADLTTDPRRVGFPPRHPPMRSFLGVPIHINGTIFGNLYLTERIGAPAFSLVDQRMAERLARHAGIAIGTASRIGEMETVLDTLPLPLTVHTAPSGALRVVNPTARALFGPLADAALGMRDLPTALHARYPDGTPLPAAAWPTARAMATGRPVENVEVMVEDRAGRFIALAVSALPIRDATGAVTEVATWYRDVTQAREAAQVRESIAALVSSAPDPPLEAIRGTVAVLLTDAEDLPGDVRAALRADLAAESDRLNRLLANVRTFAVADTGSLPMTRAPFAVPALLHDAARAMETRATAQRFVVAVPGDLPPATGDADLIALVVRNLAENAARYATPGGPVTLRAAGGNPEIVVSVSDTGPGIPPEEATPRPPTLPVPRADGQGLGLGLPLCQRLIAAHGGRLWVESTPGAGTTVSFTLPAAAPHATRAPSPPGAVQLLTPRERDVLDGLIRGRTNRRIAAALGITPNTVKSHVANIIAKLGAADRTQAAVRAVALGLARPADSEHP